MKLCDKHVLITGGSSGIGKATAKLMAHCGAHVAIVARSQQKLKAALEEIKAQAVSSSQVLGAFSVDVTQYEPVQALIGSLVQAGQAPEILINAAGSARPGYFEQLSLDAFHEMMKLNYFGTVHTCKALVPHMIARHSGTIVNVSSTAGFLGVFGYTAYGASKFAVTGFSEALRSELKPHGIHVATLFPPDTDTPGFEEENKTKPLETQIISGAVKLASAEEIARALVKGIQQERTAILPGAENKALYVLRGLLRPVSERYFDRCVDKARRTRAQR